MGQLDVRLRVVEVSLFAATILPLSTAHVICEGLGFEAGLIKISRSPSVLLAVYDFDCGRGGNCAVAQRAAVKIFIFSQVGNGAWLPIVIIFILLLRIVRI